MVNKAVSLMSMDFSVGDLRLIFVCFDHWTSFFELAFFIFFGNGLFLGEIYNIGPTLDKLLLSAALEVSSPNLIDAGLNLPTTRVSELN